MSLGLSDVAGPIGWLVAIAILVGASLRRLGRRLN
jgi:hypothetical protein